MAQASILLDEEDGIDVNAVCLNFYQANLQDLKRVSLHRIPDELKFQAAALYYGTSQYRNEWKGVLEDLGVDYITMYAIDCNTSNTGNLPIYLALNGVLQSNRSFGDFIQVLCNREKFHILLHLKPFVEELLKENRFLDEERPRPSAPEHPCLEVTCSLSGSGVSELDDCCRHDTECDSITCQEAKEKQTTALEHFQNAEAIPSFANNQQLSGVSESFNANQSIDEVISVFIMHSMLDKKYAKKLAACLKAKNFKVITSANIYKFLRENHTMIMKAVDEKVDFVIPVVSKSFMELIKFTGYYATEEKDIEVVANTFMYDRLLNEYSSRSNFFNRRVKPVCYSLESRKLGNLDQILSWSSYLPYSDLENDQVLERELLQHLTASKGRAMRRSAPSVQNPASVAFRPEHFLQMSLTRLKFS